MDTSSWQRRTEWPLAVAALVFLASYSVLVLRPGLPASTVRLLTAVDYLTWGLFVIDYVVRLSLARARGRWVLRNLPDLLIVALPLLRPLRLLRLITLLRIINRRVTTSLQGRVAAYVGLSTVLVLYAGALAVLDAERGHAGANIQTFGTALWWAVSTITTVGYGDHYPVTTTGRWVAAVLMIAGVALIGSVTATLAGWIADQVRAPRAGQETAATGTDPVPPGADELTQLRADVRRLTALLERHGPALGSPDTPRG